MSDRDNNNKSLKIVHIVDYLMPTMGYQEFLLPKWHSKHGHEVHIITSDRYYPVPNYEQTWKKFLGNRIVPAGTEIIEGVTVHRLKTLCEAKYRPYLPGLTAKIGSLAPDVIFCHGTASITGIQAARAARKYKLPLIMDNHMTFGCKDRSLVGEIGYKGLKILSRKFLDKYCYKFLGVANECCDFLIKAQGLSPEKVENLPIGIDTDIFYEKEEEGKAFRQKHNIPENAFVVMQTGKLTPDKSPHYLSEAIAPLLAENDNMRLVFVGSGGDEYLEKVKKTLNENGVEERALFLPLMPVKELAEAYSAANLLVYPDATSLSCMEAAACGRAAVMSDLPASKWRESLGVGLCYETGNIAKLREIIKDFSENPEKLSDTAEKSRASVLDNFSYDAIAKQSEKIMHDAISENSRK